MFRNIHIRLAASRLVRGLAVLANRIPLPYSHWPVTALGCRMTAHTLDRFAALWLWRTGRLEQFGVANLDRFCRPGMHAVDVGANVGFYTLQMAKRVGDGGHVYAFEPDAGNLASLRRNVQLNGFEKRVECEGSAVGASAGSVPLYRSASHHGDHRVFASDGRAPDDTVKMASLDAYFTAGFAVDLVKIDVQGAELEVLRGMERVLRENPRCVLLLEINSAANMPSGSSPGDVIDVLASSGFHVAAADGVAAEGALSKQSILSELDRRPYVDVVAVHESRSDD